MLECESGALGPITSSYVSPKTYSIRLLGTEAVLDYRTDISVWPAADKLDAMTPLTVASAVADFDPVDPLVDELGELRRCVEDEATPETGAHEGLRARRVTPPE